MNELPQQQPAFPQTNVQVTPQGVTIAIVLAPGIVLSTILNEESVNQIMKLWLETRKQIKREQETIEAVMRSRGN